MDVRSYDYPPILKVVGKTWFSIGTLTFGKYLTALCYRLPRVQRQLVSQGYFQDLRE